MARKFCGLAQEELMKAMYLICDLEDEVELDKNERKLYDAAIQCVALVANRMNEDDDRPIYWDDE